MGKSAHHIYFLLTLSDMMKGIHNRVREPGNSSLPQKASLISSLFSVFLLGIWDRYLLVEYYI